MGDEIVLAQLRPRDVDRHANAHPALAPGAGLAAGFLDDPAADRADEPVALGFGDESCRGDDAAAAVVPAQQRLGRRDLQAAGVDLRLVDERQLAALQGPAQRSDPLGALAQVDAHRGLELGVRGATSQLDGPLGRAGKLHELGPGAMLRVQRDPDRDVDAEFVAVDQMRSAECRAQREGGAVRVVACAAQRDGELVTAEPRRGGVRRQRPREPSGGAGDDRVATAVAVGGVDEAEVVEIEAEHTEGNVVV